MGRIRSIALAAIAIALMTLTLYKCAWRSLQHVDVNPFAGSQDSRDELKKLIDEVVESEWSDLIPYDTARNRYVFDCKFTALVSESGSVEVGHGNRLDWSLNHK